MNILFLGDVVGKQGCDYLMSQLPSLKRNKKVDVCIANGENSAAGNGITPESAQMLFDSGVDFITTGNHVYRRREVYDFLDERDDIIRPANYHSENPGKGYGVIDLGRYSVAVINMSGSFGIDNVENPFIKIDEMLKDIHEKIIIVDFHAETTSEKRAFGFYLDGRVSAVVGTHTHVQTADEQILKNGTGYITDLGMCGTIDSVLGVDKDIIINKMIYGMPARFDAADGKCMINGCLFEIDNSSGKTVGIERINIS